MKPPHLPRPYPEHELLPLTDAQWRERPAVDVPITDLIPTQDGLSLHHLARLHNGDVSESGDHAGRAVVHEGKLYLHDGTHRWAIAYLRGDTTLTTRVVDVHGQPATWPFAG